MPLSEETNTIGTAAVTCNGLDVPTGQVKVPDQLSNMNMDGHSDFPEKNNLETNGDAVEHQQGLVDSLREQPEQEETKDNFKSSSVSLPENGEPIASPNSPVQKDASDHSVNMLKTPVSVVAATQALSTPLLKNSPSTPGTITDQMVAEENAC